MKLPVGMLIAAFVVFISAAVPIGAAELISYQGRLTSGGSPVPDNVYTVTFSLFADSTTGSSLWQETASVTTDDGLFSHLLGSATPLSSSIFVSQPRLFLAVSLDGQALSPRTRLVSAPSAVAAHQLRLIDNAGLVKGRTETESGGVLHLYDDSGAPGIVLHGGQVSDSSVVFPDSAINADEILDEPGIASSTNIDLTDLSTGLMTDLATVEIEIPYDGFIVLYAKCYAVLSGTTGPNGVMVQIDDSAGGTAVIPYYTYAGLSGFVNTGANYFPMFVTRTYYRPAGLHEFRLEGKATHPLPAIAQTWDHIITATYFPTAYGWTSASSSTPLNNPTAVPVPLNGPGRSGIIYDLDLRYEQDSLDRLDR